VVTVVTGFLVLPVILAVVAVVEVEQHPSLVRLVPGAMVAITEQVEEVVEPL
jgi:hypothetical protein